MVVNAVFFIIFPFWHTVFFIYQMIFLLPKIANLSFLVTFALLITSINSWKLEIQDAKKLPCNV